MLRSCFLDFAFEHWFGCRAIESGFTRDIGSIEIWLNDEILVFVTGFLSHMINTNFESHLPDVNKSGQKSSGVRQLTDILKSWSRWICKFLTHVHGYFLGLVIFSRGCDVLSISVFDMVSDHFSVAAVLKIPTGLQSCFATYYHITHFRAIGQYQTYLNWLDFLKSMEPTWFSGMTVFSARYSGAIAGDLCDKIWHRYPMMHLSDHPSIGALASVGPSCIPLHCKRV